MKGRWNIERANDFGRDWHLVRGDDDAEKPIVMFVADGSLSWANLNPEHLGDWYVLHAAWLGPMLTHVEPSLYTIHRSWEAARGANYYYQQYAALMSLDPDGGGWWSAFDGRDPRTKKQREARVDPWPLLVRQREKAKR